MLTLWKPIERLVAWRPRWDEPWPTTPAWPRVHTKEEEGTYLVEVETPGMAPEEVTVELEGNDLVIRGQHEETTRSGNQTSHRKMSFFRRMPLPKNVAPDKVEVRIDNGNESLTMLEVPRKPVAVPDQAEKAEAPKAA